MGHPHAGPVGGLPAGPAAAPASLTGAARLTAAALLLALIAIHAPARAAPAVPTEQDRVTQARATAIAEQLRCLVCQNQTIADSNAGLAVDLRRQVREQIAAGRSDREIVDFMTARYGDFVLYRPPFRATTLLLWAGPALLLAIGAFVVLRVVGARRGVDPPPLTREEHERAQQLFADGRPAAGESPAVTAGEGSR